MRLPPAILSALSASPGQVFRLARSCTRNVSPMPNSSVFSCMRRSKASAPQPSAAANWSGLAGIEQRLRERREATQCAVRTRRPALSSAVKFTCAVMSRRPASSKTSSSAVCRRYPMRVPGGKRTDSRACSHSRWSEQNRRQRAGDALHPRQRSQIHFKPTSLFGRRKVARADSPRRAPATARRSLHPEKRPSCKRHHCPRKAPSR